MDESLWWNEEISEVIYMPAHRERKKVRKSVLHQIMLQGVEIQKARNIYRAKDLFRQSIALKEPDLSW